MVFDELPLPVQGHFYTRDNRETLVVIDQLKKQWFFIGIAVMVLIAFGLPSVGLFIREYKILNIGIFLAFFLQFLLHGLRWRPESFTLMKSTADALATIPPAGSNEHGNGIPKRYPFYGRGTGPGRKSPCSCPIAG